jgi:integrase
MILNFFSRQDRRNFYVQFTDPKTGKRRVMSTPVRKTEPDAQLKLAKIRNRLEHEILESHVVNRSADQDHGWAWVTPWMQQRHGRKRASLVKHRNQWNYLSAYFNEKNVHGPRAVTRDIALTYVGWRAAQLKEKSKRGACRNTALADLRWGTCLLNEAVARGEIIANPWSKLGFERDDAAEKPEFSDAEILRVRDALSGRPEWMRTSFEIALHTGLRFGETRIPFSALDLDARTALIAAPKGGKERAFTIPLAAALIPMLRLLQRQGERETWHMPPAQRPFTGLVWSKFFREIGLGHLCFHGTRVTFISRGARAGVPEHAMRKLVNHASASVHRIYQRVTTADGARYVDLVPIPPPDHTASAAPLSRPGSPTKKPSRRGAAAVRASSTSAPRRTRSRSAAPAPAS